VHDVGAIAILMPSGSVRAGDAVIPRARIKSFGNTAERFFDVRFRIGTSYSRTANVANALLPDSTVELTFAPWAADSGYWAVSCSTMLASDVNRANDKVSSSVRVLAQSLQIKPDQSDRLEVGKGKTPYKTLTARLTLDISRAGSKSTFVRQGFGLYGLRDRTHRNKRTRD
jgi:hypothetical protein